MRRVVIVGVGSIGERHLRCFGKTGRAILGFVEVNAGLREVVAARYPDARPFPTLEAALEEHWDAAVVATPAHTHIPISTCLAVAGVYLLVEKPVSTSLEGVVELQRIVAESSLKACVAYVHRASPVLTQMRRALRDGRFGKPLQVVAVCGQHFPTFRPQYREIYYADRAKGGGAIQDALTHIINAAEWLVGPVDRVVADAAHLQLDGVSVEDTAHVLTRHGDVLGSYSLNQWQSPNEIQLTVLCERGAARYEPHRTAWRWMDQINGEWHDEPHPAFERDTLFIAQANAFLDAVDGKADVLCTLAEGATTLKANLAMLKSADATPWQRIEPD